MFITNEIGVINYDNPSQHLFEFVDDNDDADRYADWNRRFSERDHDGIFPGWDENNDFRPDINRNTNKIPDYEEPFLRYSVDPPEFLFGVDMNNNTIIDRFEDDELPDYPYKPDHHGYNAYIGSEIVPNVRLLVGRSHEELWSTDERARATYALFTVERVFPGFGKLRLSERTKWTKDDLRDNVLQWVQRRGTFGQDRVLQKDPLVAQDTWINTTFLGFDYTGISNFNSINIVKYEFYDQRDPAEGMADLSRFLGIINKADYTLSFRGLDIRPKIKSMYRYRTPYMKADKDVNELNRVFVHRDRHSGAEQVPAAVGRGAGLFQRLDRRAGFQFPNPRHAVHQLYRLSGICGDDQCRILVGEQKLQGRLGGPPQRALHQRLHQHFRGPGIGA